MSIAEHYSRWSGQYDQEHNRTRDLDAQWVRERLQRRRFDHVLEVGCGTGKNTQVLAPCASRITAVDFSEGMLAQARVKLAAAAHVRFLQADITQPWPLPDGFADLVTFNLVLEHIAHLGPVLGEAARCLRADGQVWISELHPYRQYEGTQARYTDALGGTTFIPAHLHHISDYTAAARTAGLHLIDLTESWHAEDTGRPPRLLCLTLAAGGAD